MFEYHDPKEARTRSPSVIEDEWLRGRVEEGDAILFTQFLRKALYELEETRAPPKRRDPYDLYLDGYFEFQESGPFKAELTPTPPSTNEPNTPADKEPSNPFVSVREHNNKQQGSDQCVDDASYDSKIIPQCLKAVSVGRISRKSQRQKANEISAHPMRRRSLTSNSDVFYELNSSGRKMVPLLRHGRRASKRK